MKNREVVLVTPGTIDIREAEIPTPGDEEVLVEIADVGMCGSDIHAFQFGPYIPPKDPNQKIGLGHEFSGVVKKVGNKVTKIKAGDRVICEPGIPCGKCKYCLSGHYNICPNVDFMATQPNYRGALTDCLVHPASFVYKLPDNMSFAEGALIEPAAVGMHAAERAGVKPGKSIVILGAGCIGLMTLQACRIMGASEIIVVDMIEKRLEKALSLGAKKAVNSKEVDAVAYCREYFDGGADIVFETAGANATANMTTKLVDRGGKIMIVGTIPGETPINFLSINREVSIETVFRYCNNFPMTIDAVSSGRFDVASMITNEYEFVESQKAFDESVSKKNEIIKSVIHVGKFD